MIKKIISGGQTGADRAALDAAIELGIPHGGWVPKGRLAEDGPIHTKYQVQEMPTDSYTARTEQNVIDSDGTLILSHGELTGGSGFTRKMAMKHGKPWYHADLNKMPSFQAAMIIEDWVSKNGIIRKNYDKGIAPLTVKTKYKDQHHFIKLVRQADENEILSCFIRGGTSLSLEVPVGSYKLKSAVGSTWYGIRYLFGPNTVYSEADKIFNFNFVGDQVSGYTVELFLQPQGNMRTDTISLFQF